MDESVPCMEWCTAQYPMNISVTKNHPTGKHFIFMHGNMISMHENLIFKHGNFMKPFVFRISSSEFNAIEIYHGDPPIDWFPISFSGTNPLEF